MSHSPMHVVCMPLLIKGVVLVCKCSFPQSDLKLLTTGHGTYVIGTCSSHFCGDKYHSKTTMLRLSGTDLHCFNIIKYGLKSKQQMEKYAWPLNIQNRTASALCLLKIYLFNLDIELLRTINKIQIIAMVFI